MRYLYFTLMIFLFASCSEQKNEKMISLVWEMGENNIEEGIYENTFHLINHSSDTIRDNWAIFFNQQPAAVKPDAEEIVSIEQISSTYYKMRPTVLYQNIAPKDTLKITFRCEGSILKMASAPEGAYCVWLDEKGNDREIQDVSITVIPYTNSAQWSRKGTTEIPYPYGERVYEENKIFTQKVDLELTDIFPSIKNVEKQEGIFTFLKEVNVECDSKFENEGNLLKAKLKELYNCSFSTSAKTVISLKSKKLVDAKNNEQYELQAKDGAIEIFGETNHAIFNGTQTLLSILGANKLPLEINNISLTDYPDLAHRGFMLDVARNFTTKTNLLKLIDVLASYKVNVLHIHLTDDEGWRLEIPGIEELTTVGAKRGHTYDEREMTFPAYGGGWNPNSTESLANGFYSRQEFIEILNYAKERHVKVIPEIDLPAHARAAIKATTARYYKYINTDKVKAEEYLLEDFNDTSVYLSAQSYRHNAVNVALPSVYTFVKKVLHEVDAMYTDAGLELEILHLGGDEVPSGTWTRSDICQKFMKEKKFTEIRELKDYFISETLKIFNEKGVQMAAWQEVGLLPNESVNPKFAKDNVLSYCWNTIPDWESDDIPYRLANAGYPVILSSVSNLYFDMTYNKHEDEPGAYWAGFVNEYDPFNFLPYNIYYSVRNDMAGNPINLEKEAKRKQALLPHAKENIKGVQAQLWAETIRNFDMIEHYIFPKMFGLVERGWNTHPSWADNPLGQEYTEALKLYNAKMTQHGMPLLVKKIVGFRMPLPGLMVENGKLLINTSVEGAKVYYTTDGSIPTQKSTLWTAPVNCDAEIVRAKAFYLGKESATTLYKR